jgi:DNA-binding LacI/PurR family transcriptional regulator
MTTQEIDRRTQRQPGQRKASAAKLMRQLEDLCDHVGPGGRIPRHTELMLQFGASQHSVIRSLEELQRRGRIVRRHGSGTFVTDGLRGEGADVPAETIAPLSTTIVAIERPDLSVFDRCVEMLYAQTAAAGLDLVCRFVGSELDGSVNAAAFGNPLGFILFQHHFATLARQLQSLGNRVVLIGTPHSGETFNVPSIHGNQEYGGYLVVKHLIDLGHRRLAIWDATGDLMSSMRGRGYSKALREAERSGVAMNVELFGEASISAWMESPGVLVAAVRKPDGPTAIVGWNDDQALQLMSLLNRSGVSVPGEVSVTGYDNLPQGRLFHPFLTTVETMLDSQVGAAIDLIAAPQRPSPYHVGVYAPTLVARESSAPPSR